MSVEYEQRQLELIRMDIELRRKQAFWETPRNIVILLGVVGTLMAAVAGLAGYKAGSQSNPPPIIIQVPAAK